MKKTQPVGRGRNEICQKNCLTKSPSYQLTIRDEPLKRSIPTDGRIYGGFIAMFSQIPK